MYWQIVIMLMITAPMIIIGCKQTEHLDPASLTSANDQVKIAVNYIGDEKCRVYLDKLSKEDKIEEDKIEEVIGRNKEYGSSHLLNGKDGELITENYRSSHPRRHNLKLSGDRFFGREPTGEKTLAIETIEENCRRLLLSVDSSTPPTMTFTNGFIAKNQAERFKEDFLDDDDQFGEIKCEENNGFCTFSKINNGNRHFAYLEPHSGSDNIWIKSLTYYAGDTKKEAKDIELKNINFKEKSRYQDVVTPIKQSYVSHLYVAFAKVDGSNWTTEIGNPYFKVSLQTESTDEDSKNVEAVGRLNLNDRDLTKNVVSFKVSTICQELLESKCEKDHSNFRQLLLANNAKLSFAYKTIEASEGDEKKHKLTESFIDNWLQRKGEIYFGEDLEAQWSSFKFIFTNPKQQNLYLSYLQSPESRLRYEIKSLALEDCPVFKGNFYPSTTAIINRKTLLDHFDNSKRAFFHIPWSTKKCVTRDDGVSDLEFLKKSGLTLFIKSNSETYKHMFTNESIDNWWREIGEITAVAEETNNDQEGSGQSAKELVLGLQDRR